MAYGPSRVDVGVVVHKDEDEDEKNGSIAAIVRLLSLPYFPLLFTERR